MFFENKYGIGGFLPLEVKANEKEMYVHQVIRLNTARNAISLAMRDGLFTKILVPLYICESVVNTLKRCGYAVDYFHIDENFQPILNEQQLLELTSSNTVMLIVNYYGLYFPAKNIDFTKNLIIDNTQAFYEPPKMEFYNVYSCRKFFGVSDGAYLIKNDLSSYDFPKDYSYERATYLLKSFELGTDSAYHDYLLSEDSFEDAKILLMSDLTRSIMGSIEYQKINNIRINNFNILNVGLHDINQLSFNNPLNSPIVYPLLIENNTIRQKLLENKIFVPQWWKWCLNTNLCNSFEEKLCKYLIPLPIDQRYSKIEMQYVVDFINSCI